MKPRIVLVCLAIGLIAASLAIAQAPATPLPDKKPVGMKAAMPAYDFKALMAKVCEAWSSGDPAKAGAYYAKDPGLVFYDVAPVKYTGWTEYAAGAAQLFASYTSLSVKPTGDENAHQRGNMAWGTATLKLEGTKKDGTKDTFDGRWTVIWEKRGSDWLIIHDHTSVPLPPPPAENK
jgi:ketosteroid isomerase-like protein